MLYLAPIRPPHLIGALRLTREAGRTTYRDAALLSSQGMRRGSRVRAQSPVQRLKAIPEIA